MSKTKVTIANANNKKPIFERKGTQQFPMMDYSTTQKKTVTAVKPV